MFRYCAPFLFLIAIPTLYYLSGPIAPLATIGILVIALVSAEWILPFFQRERRNNDLASTRGERSRALPLFYIPLQLAVIAWATWVRARDTVSASAELSMILSVGVIAGVFGMLAAHEMAHSRSRVHQLFAFAMLMGTANPQFRIAHVYGHHRFAGLRRDAATARLGESFYAFLIRTLPQQWHESFAFEGRRCAKRGHGLAYNRALRDLLCLALLVGTLAFFSRRGALF